MGIEPNSLQRIKKHKEATCGNQLQEGTVERKLKREEEFRFVNGVEKQ